MTQFFVLAILRAAGLLCVMDLEDVAERKAIPGGRLNALRYRVRDVAMRLCFKVVHAFILPTSTFLAHTPDGVPGIVVEYVLTDDETQPPHRVAANREPVGTQSLGVLFSGPYTEGHGVRLVESCLQLLAAAPTRPPIAFHFTGRISPAFSDVARNVLGAGLDVSLHGNLRWEDYRQLLASVDVGLGLQLATGPFARSNIPSKVFEYIANGKLAVVTGLDSLASLDTQSLVPLREETGDELLAVLTALAKTQEQWRGSLGEWSALARRAWRPESQGVRLRDFIENLRAEI